MEEINNAPNPKYVGGLLQRIEELEQKLEAREIVSVSYKKIMDDTKESVEALVHKHLDLEGTEFFDQIVDLFDIELTKTVTVQFKVSVEVQATVPFNMDNEEIEEELKSAKLDYEFLGNGDIEIEAFAFEEIEVE
jgi:sugar-specific transcriptional regulator TrmB